MVKVTPDPPEFCSDSPLTRRAIDYYLKACAPDGAPFVLNDNMSFEDALARAADLLHCAVATAQIPGEPMNGQQRAVMHLVEMAKVVVDRSLDCLQPR
ncbi:MULTISPECIES: DUF6124 family protein [unclassified Pseudomonas]|uniref:DUF6124 family protein n=1 Tax=unclassified Pseudomonas TaxID=196821 RepID=UPI0010689162|nr:MULTISPECIES: DUF3077 domain-containing protein [unclassified Pseudomonas]NWB62048.1 DUF3077 domain-containing protein [Pseudomonas sp. F1002]NWC01475.1 DUF3077 domain-containing protein [Pseudomonas sp. G1002]QBQ13675.1 DUF3077 domain-containing protein [Pseudomonas sp. SXM-1]